MLGISLEEQGFKGLKPLEKKRWVCKGASILICKAIRDGYKTITRDEINWRSIGYDDDMMRAFYKAMQAAGMRMQNYGTVFASINDESKEDALPLIRGFYDLGFNIEATEGTAQFLKNNGVRPEASSTLITA